MHREIGLKAAGNEFEISEARGRTAILMRTFNQGKRNGKQTLFCLSTKPAGFE
jgi:hypothetical protein